MAKANLQTIPLYPEDRDCAAPSATRIIEIFAGIQRHHLTRRGRHVQFFEPTLTRSQRQVLKLLAIPATIYQTAQPSAAG
jgi:hypothetical protein